MKPKTVYYTCSFVPPELIAACGGIPQRLVPALQDGNTAHTEGMCAFTEAWLETLLGNVKRNEDFVAVFTTSCDQMRRAFDLYCHRSGRDAFLLNVPSTTTVNSLNYYQQELERLQTFLCTVYGERFDESRLEKLMLSSDLNNREPKSNGSPKIALVGGPVPASTRNILNTILKTSNSGIFFDAAEDTLIHQFQEIKTTSLKELAAHYFQLPAIWKRPNDLFYDWFTQKIREKEIDGILLAQPVFCDLWHSQFYEFKNRFDIPALDIELDGRDSLPAAVVSRIQAFSETLAT